MFRFKVCLLVALIALCIAQPLHAQSTVKSEVISTLYCGDVMFPQYNPGWTEGWSERDTKDRPILYTDKTRPVGGYIHVFFCNSGKDPLKVSDVKLDGVSLNAAIATIEDTLLGYHPASIHFSKLPKQTIDKAIAAGEPVWWKVEPGTVQPGKIGEVVIRLRHTPKNKVVAVDVVSQGQTIKSSVSLKAQPQFTDISFSPDYNTVYLFLKPTKKGTAPTRFMLNGGDITSFTTAVYDKFLDITPAVVKLAKPLSVSEYCCFQAVYSDGSVATAGVRAYGGDMVYGMWGCGPTDARATYQDWAKHNINTQMGQANKDTMEMSLAGDGFDFLQKLGFRQMATWQGNAKKPIYYFIQDEPDAQDFGVEQLKTFDRVGALGRGLVEKCRQLREKDPVTAQLLNLDNTFKPVNWYTYAQLPDVPCADPYYNVRIGNTSMPTDAEIAFQMRPTCVYATSEILQSARAPKPMHIILLSTMTEFPDGSVWWPSPEGKAIEAFYALGAGAKGLSYWWFTPGAGANGCGADDPRAKALYREIGLLGAQIRTAGPLITSSTPVKLPVMIDDDRLWVRTLVSGLDTVIVLVANNDITCDRAGTVVLPVKKADVKVTPPSWLKTADVFEINYDGVQDAKWAQDSSSVNIDMGLLNATKMYIITSNSKLRNELQALYKDKFAANVAAIK